MDNLSPLLNLLWEVIDQIILAGDFPIHKQAHDRIERMGKPSETVPQHVLVAKLSAYVRLGRGEPTVLMAPVGSETGNTGDLLLAWSRERKALILGYFKSLHDQGMWLSTASSGPHPGARWSRHLRKLVAGYRVARARGRSRQIDLSQVDWLMVFTQLHAQMVGNRAGKVTSLRPGINFFCRAGANSLPGLPTTKIIGDETGLK